MNKKDFDELINGLNEQIKFIRQTKGQVYCQDIDQFANFKRISQSTGVCPYAVWSVYYHKHHDAIMNFVKGNYNDTEPIEGRILDAITYLQLLYGMVQESREYVR